MAVEINVTPAASGARRLAVGRNTLILLASNFSSAAFGLLVSVLIARGAGEAALGAYSLALAWSLTLAQFADLGMSTLLTRDLAREPAHTASYLWASLVSKTVLGAVLVLALFLAAPVLVQGDHGMRALKFGSALILLNTWYGSFTAIFRAFGRMLPILVINVGGLALQAVLTWFVIVRGANAEILVALAVLVQLLQFLAAAAFYLAGFPNAREKQQTDWRSILQLTRAGIPFAIAGILGSIELRANVLMLGALEGDRAVGWYSAASRLNEGIRLAPNAFFGAVLPALAALSASQNYSRLRHYFRRREFALIGFGGGAAVLLSLTSPWLIPFLYGESFMPAVTVLIVLGWGLVPALVSGLLILYLYARGDERFVNWLIGAGLLVQVGAAFLLMRVYGATGAAAAALVSDCLLWFLLRRRIAQLDDPTRADWRAVARVIVPPFVLFIVALVVRVVPIVQYSFDGLYGQDAYAYYSYSRQLFDALGHLQPPPPFWWSLGYPALLNIGFLIGGVNIASAQAITLLCGALVAPAAYALARQAAPEPYKTTAGWVAGLVCAVSGQLVQSSIVIMADAPALLFATLGAWLLLRYARTRALSALCIAALAVGMAVWMRWQNLIFAGIWVVALVLVEFARTDPGHQDGSMLRNIRIRNTVLALALMGFVLVPQLFLQTTANAPLAGQSWLEGWSPANFFARTFDTIDGHFDYALPPAIFYGQVFVHPAYLVALLTPLFVIGAVHVGQIYKFVPHPFTRLEVRQIYKFVPSLSGRSQTGQIYKFVPLLSGPFQVGQIYKFVLQLTLYTGKIGQIYKFVLLGGWILAMYLFLAGIPYENFRFSLGLFSPVAVLTGIGAGWLWERLAASRFRPVLVGFIVLALGIMLFWQPRVYAPILEIKARELDQAQWLSLQIADYSLVWTMSVEGALNTYTPLRVANLWQRSANELRASAPAYLFIDAGSIKTQWRNSALAATFHTLQSSGHLEPLGMRSGFTLFRIKP